jgi:hypothetical protein
MDSRGVGERGEEMTQTLYAYMNKRKKKKKKEWTDMLLREQDWR